LRQDDGIGRRAAELLEEKLGPGAANITLCHQLTPELAATFADAPLVLFLDAALDQEPGLVLYRKVSPQCLAPGSHHLSPEQLLDLARTLNGAAPPAFLITGGVRQTEVSDALTPAAERCAARMADVALKILSTTVWPPDAGKVAFSGLAAAD
jgi:hydrogenase maturation protease